MSAEPDWNIAAVVLCWNGIEDTLRCLRSLADSDWPRLDIIVVDNGSTDDTPAAVRAAGLANVVIENGVNVGFAAGNNVGIEAALARGADAVLVLNNDTVVDRHALTRMAEALAADPGAAACSPVLPYSSEPSRLWFAGTPYDVHRGHSGRLSSFEAGAPLPQVPIEIDRAVGAAMLVRREAVERVGMFAEELFFLYEDVDWSLRMRAAGWRILLVPGARVVHEVGASQGGHQVTPTTAYYGTRNDLELGRRHGSGGWRRQLVCVGVHVAQVRRAPPGTRLAASAATLAGVRDHLLKRLGARGAPD